MRGDMPASRIASAIPLRRVATLHAADAPAALTDVALTEIDGRLEQWLAFGRVTADRPIDRWSRILSFRLGAIFALVRRTSTDFGTVHTAVHILLARAPGETSPALPFVPRGAEVLLRIEGVSLVDRVVEAIAALEAAGIDPCDVPPQHWRDLARHLATGSPLRLYTAERHAAWLRRKVLEA